MNKIEISRRYIHNDKIYKVVNFVNLRNSSGFVNGIIYQEVTDGEEITDTRKLSVISEEEFAKNFSPYNLCVGDVIHAYSMSKLICTYYVVEVKDGKAYFSINMMGERSELVTCDNINSEGRVGVLNPDPRIKHINCLEYYLETPKLKRVIYNKRYIDKIRTTLMNISMLIGKVDVSLIYTEALQDYYQELEEFSKRTKEQIKSWQQSKIQ